MRDQSLNYKIKRSIGVTSMMFLLLFAAFPIIWVLILSIRPQSSLFDPIWENPGDWSLENFSAIFRSNFPLGIFNSFVTAALQHQQGNKA